jgi:hypothetical protein
MRRFYAAKIIPNLIQIPFAQNVSDEGKQPNEFSDGDDESPVLRRHANSMR